MPKLSVSISRVSVEGLKLVILSADFLLNFVGWLIDVTSLDPFVSWLLEAFLLSAIMLAPHGFFTQSSPYAQVFP